MKLDFVNHLLEVEMTISYHTLISSDIADKIGIYFENGDLLVSSYGIGGEKYSFRNPVDFIKLGNYEIQDMNLDLCILDHWGINGLMDSIP